jgi:serine/threonine protein kinase
VKGRDDGENEIMSNFTPLPIGTILQKRYQLTADEDELATQTATAPAGQTNENHILGIGGMGAVYLAQHTRLKRLVALKQTLLAADATMVRAFEREAQLLSALKHPALATVTDFFDEGNSYFLVMELVRGDNLLKEMEKAGGKLPVEKVLSIALQLLAVLDYLHNNGIIHRDIKPANLKLTVTGQLKLLDFGLAKGHAGFMSEHNSSILKGSTPAYASPEQAAEMPTDPRSDLYSTAATLFHLACGEVPPRSEVRLQHINSQKPDPLRLVSDINAKVPRWFAEILHKALSLAPDKRFKSSAEMSQEVLWQEQLAKEEEERIKAENAKEQRISYLTRLYSKHLLDDSEVLLQQIEELKNLLGVDEFKKLTQKLKSQRKEKDRQAKESQTSAEAQARKVPTTTPAAVPLTATAVDVLQKVWGAVKLGLFIIFVTLVFPYIVDVYQFADCRIRDKKCDTEHYNKEIETNLRHLTPAPIADPQSSASLTAQMLGKNPKLRDFPALTNKPDLFSQFNQTRLLAKPSPAVAYNDLGFAYYKNGYHDRALNAFSKSIELGHPKRSTVYWNRANVHAKQWHLLSAWSDLKSFLTKKN